MKPEPNEKFYFPTTGIAVEDDALLLAIDDASLPLKHNLCLYLTKPEVRPDAVLTPEPKESIAPDNSAAAFYGTVLHDEGRFRIWYYACHWETNPDWPAEMKRQLVNFPGKLFMGPICYAESADGIHWNKPNLGQVLFKGSRDNNAIKLPHILVSGATVIKDETEPDPARRYKMVYEFWSQYSEPKLEGLSGEPTAAMAISPDGISWQVIGTPYPKDFIEHASFYQHDGKYIVNSHHIETQIPGEGGTGRGRTGFARLAYDFDHWLEGHVESFALPEPTDPQLRGIKAHYDQVHLGTGAVSFGTVCVGLYGIWHNADFHNEFGEISGDLGLLVSNDGLRFREPVKHHVYISRLESPVPPAGNGKPYPEILTQANGILNVGDETRIYHGRWRNAGQEGEEEGDVEYFHCEVALATLPRDRWGGLGLFPGLESGFVWSAPVVLPAAESELFLNADGANGMKVEVGNERFELLPDYSGEASGAATGEGGLDCRVEWPVDGLQALAGRTVRFKISIQRGREGAPMLYAASLRKKH